MPYVQENVQLHYSFLFQICYLHQSTDPPKREIQKQTQYLDSSFFLKNIRSNSKEVPFYMREKATKIVAKLSLKLKYA